MLVEESPFLIWHDPILLMEHKLSISTDAIGTLGCRYVVIFTSLVRNVSNLAEESLSFLNSVSFLEVRNGQVPVQLPLLLLKVHLLFYRKQRSK